jgi:hypothetical protein
MSDVIIEIQDPIYINVEKVAGTGGGSGVTEWGDITGSIVNQTDLQSALNNRVPYTGASADVNLGEFGVQLGNLEFDNTPTNIPTAAGSMYWSDTDGTLNLVLKGGNVVSKVGESLHIRAYNNTGTAIQRGKVVYISGSQGQRLTIALADADTEFLSKDTIGITAEDIADGAEGFVIIAGVIGNVNTNGMVDGATVFLSTTAGSYTTTAPNDPAHLVILGFVVKGNSSGAGSIYIKVDNGYEIEELHNVTNSAKTTIVDADAFLIRDSADNNLWKRFTFQNLKGALNVGTNRYVVTFGSGNAFDYALNIFGFDINKVTFYNPSGDEVSVAYNVSDKLYVSSNVNLLNHKMIVN